MTASEIPSRTPVVRRTEDGSLDVEWPDPRPATVEIASELLDEMIATHNDALEFVELRRVRADYRARWAELQKRRDAMQREISTFQAEWDAAERRAQQLVTEREQEAKREPGR